MYQPYAPVSHLILLLSIKVHESLQQVRQAVARISQRNRRMVGIKKANYVKAKIALKPHNIHKSAMEYLLLDKPYRNTSDA